MKLTFAKTAFTFVLLALMVQGYQCGSPEMTGARVYITQKNYKAAADQLEKETKKNPSNEEAWFMLGQMRGELKDFEGMNAAYDEALKIDPNKHGKEIQGNRRYYWGQNINAGVDFLKKGETTPSAFDSAVVEFHRAIAAWPDTFLTHRYLAYAYNGKNDDEGTIKAFGTAWNLGKQSDDAKSIGQLMLSKGVDKKKKFEDENAEKLKAQKNLTEVDKGWSKSDVLRVIGAPDSKKAVKGTKKEDWMYPKYNLTLTFDGERVTNRAMSKPYNPGIDSTQALLAATDFRAAGEWLEKARAVGSKDPQIFRFLLQVYIETGKTKSAIATFEEAGKNEPTKKDIFYVLGHLYRSDSQYDNSIKNFSKALELDPDYADALNELGTTYYNWGVNMLRAAQEKNSDDQSYKEKLKAALPYFERYTTLKPDEANVWETLANIYGRIGQNDKAANAIKQADKIRAGK